MGKYKVVNPRVIGTFDDTYQVQNVDDAAKKFWENLTKDNKYISGNVPQFLFTIMDVSTNDLYHYKVLEKMEGKSANYKISKIDLKLTNTQKEGFLNQVEKINKMTSQQGGDEEKKKKRKRYNDDDSSSSDDSDFPDEVDELFSYIRRKRVKKPIVYWWYNPTLYKIDTIFTPTFSPGISPYFQLWIPSVI